MKLFITFATALMMSSVFAEVKTSLDEINKILGSKVTLIAHDRAARSYDNHFPILSLSAAQLSCVEKQLLELNNVIESKNQAFIDRFNNLNNITLFFSDYGDYDDSFGTKSLTTYVTSIRFDFYNARKRCVVYSSKEIQEAVSKMK